MWHRYNMVIQLIDSFSLLSEFMNKSIIKNDKMEQSKAQKIFLRKSKYF